MLSICPPHAAADTARLVAGGSAGGHPLFVDANAVSPATARDIGKIIATGGGFVDGGIIGPPPGAGRLLA